MSIRQQRQELANLRAMEEEHDYDMMHGRGGVPSMGTSEIRGGARKAKGRRRKPRYYDDEDEMEGGFIGALAGLAARLIPTIARGATTAARVGSTAARGALTGVRGAVRSVGSKVKPKAPPKPTSTAIVPYNPATAAARTGTAIVPKTTGALSTATRGATTAATTGATAATTGSRLGTIASRLGTAANIAIPVAMAADYLANQPSSTGATDTGYYEDYAGEVGGIPEMAPSDAGVAEGMLPSGRLAPAPSARQTGRVVRGNVMTNVVGSGRHDKRSARAAVVRRVMREHGMSLPEASRYVKQNGLY